MRNNRRLTPSTFHAVLPSFGSQQVCGTCLHPYHVTLTAAVGHDSGLVVLPHATLPRTRLKQCSQGLVSRWGVFCLHSELL
ncbi:hypothetical protein X975_07559, partial [Stegodyphus mimosarum]